MDGAFRYVKVPDFFLLKLGSSTTEFIQHQRNQYFRIASITLRVFSNKCIVNRSSEAVAYSSTERFSLSEAMKHGWCWRIVEG